MKIRKRFLSFLIGGVVLFAGLVFTAISVIDSPATMQLRKNDEKRISDIKEVSSILLSHYEDGKPLQDGIVKATRNDSSRNYMQDPISKELYGYRRISNHEFELCADFDTSSIDYSNFQSFYFAGQSMNLAHSAGKHCFRFDMRQETDD